MDKIALDWTMRLIGFIRSKERLEMMVSKIATACREQRNPIFEQSLLKLMRDERPEIRHMAYENLNICQEILSKKAQKKLEEYRTENLTDKGG